MLKKILASFLLSLVLVIPQPGIAEVRVPESRGEIALSFAPIVKKVAPAVVNIYTRKVVRQRVISPFMDDPFFQQFFGNQYPQGLSRQRVQSALGSGVIVGAEGLVVTNNHVIDGADEVVVVLADKREFAASLVASDKRSDLAVLRLKTKGETFPTITFMDSDAVNTGDVVLAIGNPFGVGQTVTMGIVSAVARATDVSNDDYNYFIQTDAAINPGNSGGALVGVDGRLVGIPSVIYSQGGGSLGIGFAIPANLVQSVLAAARHGGQIIHPWTGFTVQDLTRDLAASVGLENADGVLVKSIHPASPAGKAGLKVGDVVLTVNGHAVPDAQALRFRIGTLAVGSEATLGVWRDRQHLTLSFPLIAPPELGGKNGVVLNGKHPLSGAKVADFSPAIAEQLGLAEDDSDNAGVVVLGVSPRSPAAFLGVQRGDRIAGVNGQAIESVDQLNAALKQAAGAPMQLAIRRGDQLVQLVVR